MENKKVTKQQVEAWLGNDDIIDILQLIANGEYSPENLKKDISEYGTFCLWCEKHFYETDLNEHGHCDRCQRAIDSRG